MGLALAGALLLASHAAGAKDAALAGPDALKVMQACRYGDVIKAYLDVNSQTYAETIAKSGGKPDAATISKIDGLIRPVFENLLSQLQSIRIDMLTSKLTGQELDQLAAFCSSPLGQKFLSVEVDTQGELYQLFHPVLRTAYRTAWLEHRKDFLDLGLVFKENAK